MALDAGQADLDGPELLGKAIEFLAKPVESRVQPVEAPAHLAAQEGSSAEDGDEVVPMIDAQAMIPWTWLISIVLLASPGRSLRVGSLRGKPIPSVPGPASGTPAV